MLGMHICVCGLCIKSKGKCKSLIENAIAYYHFNIAKLLRLDQNDDDTDSTEDIIRLDVSSESDTKKKPEKQRYS